MTTVARLLETTLLGKILSGSFVAENNNEGYSDAAGVTTVTLFDQADKPIAFGAVVPYTKTSIYCNVDTVSEKFKDHTIWIEEASSDEVKMNRTYKIVKDIPQLIKPNHQNQFETVFSYSNGKPAFEHVFEKLIQNTIGFQQFDTEKNLTVDVIADSEEELLDVIARWRDTVGTIVSDRNKFRLCDVNRFELLGLEDEKSDIQLEAINNENLFDILDYDAEISVFNREKHLTAVIQTTGAFGFAARSGRQVTGYGLALGNRILQCYGENEETVRQLLATMAAEMMTPEVTMCMRDEGYPVMVGLLEKANKVSRIARLHTRTHPNGIKWSKVACANMGLHLF